MKIAIVKYNGGNVESVKNALKRLHVEPLLTDDAETLANADKIIFPGVGEASSAMNYLRSKNLDSVIVNLRQPVLGICLGMQLLCEYSEESDTECLGILPSKVSKFTSAALKIPQIGWNTTTNLQSELFKDIDENSYFYFVHSFYVEAGEKTIAHCDYTVDFSAAMRHKNFYAVQFHPEKSGETGEKVLKNFLEL